MTAAAAAARRSAAREALRLVAAAAAALDPAGIAVVESDTDHYWRAVAESCELAAARLQLAATTIRERVIP